MKKGSFHHQTLFISFGYTKITPKAARCRKRKWSAGGNGAAWRIPDGMQAAQPAGLAPPCEKPRGRKKPFVKSAAAAKRGRSSLSQPGRRDAARRQTALPRGHCPAGLYRSCRIHDSSFSILSRMRRRTPGALPESLRIPLPHPFYGLARMRPGALPCFAKADRGLCARRLPRAPPFDKIRFISFPAYRPAAPSSGALFFSSAEETSSWMRQRICVLSPRNLMPYR